MRNSKKGVTLVELIICCAIIVMLGGACVAVLASGSNVFNNSSLAANAQIESNAFQDYLLGLIPSANNVDTNKTLDQAKALSSGTAIFIDNDDLVIRTNGKNTTFRSIDKLTYSIIRAGDESSSTARCQFVYEAVLKNGKKLKGGLVLTNISYVAGDMDAITDILASNKPICFNVS